MKLLILSFTLLSVIYAESNTVFTSTVIKRLVNGSCGIATGAPLVQQLTATVTYAGGLFWADDGEKIAYIDRFGPGYGRYTPNDGRFNHMSIDGGKETIAIFPAKNATGLKFVIGMDRRLVLSVVTGSGSSLNSNIYPLITVSNKTSEKFMKGKIDAKGRLWYSSSDGLLHNKGRLYKIENLGTPVVMEQNLHTGAGMAWTEDYKYFYLVESNKGIIYKYDFSLSKGTIANRRIIFEMRNHTELVGKPFDIVIDKSGYIWIGLLHGGSVVQYSETTRSILWNIAIPASDIVSLEFGGLDKKTLYVGTSKQYLRKSAGQAAAGSILAVSGLGQTGIPDNEIVIPDKYLNL